MPITEVQRFYKDTFELKSSEIQLIKSALIEAESPRAFVDLAVKLGRQHGYIFTKKEMEETLDGFGEREHMWKITEDDDPWVLQVIRMGWVPLGYSR